MTRRCRGPRALSGPTGFRRRSPPVDDLDVVVQRVHGLGPLRTIRSQLLFFQLRQGPQPVVFGLQREADEPLPVLARRRAWPRRRRFRPGATRSGSPVLAILSGRDLHGPIVARRGHADQAVARGKHPLAGVEHVFGRDDADHFAPPPDTSTSTGPLTIDHLVPAASAASASALPIRPLEALVR